MSIENTFNNPPQETPKPEDKKEQQPKPENPEILPTTESTERAELTPDEIEEALQKMEVKILDRKKLISSLRRLLIDTKKIK